MTPSGRRDGYSVPYRIGFRIQYALMHVFGPPSLDARRDPRRQMKADHDRRRALWEERRAARRDDRS